MAAKQFHVATPEQLRELAAYVNSGKLNVVIGVWSSMKRGHGATILDREIHVFFSGDRKRIAEVMRINKDGRSERLASLRYNPALNWCELYLKETD